MVSSRHPVIGGLGLERLAMLAIEQGDMFGQAEL